MLYAERTNNMHRTKNRSPENLKKGSDNLSFLSSPIMLNKQSRSNKSLPITLNIHHNLSEQRNDQQKDTRESSSSVQVLSFPPIAHTQISDSVTNRQVISKPGLEKQISKSPEVYECSELDIDLMVDSKLPDLVNNISVNNDFMFQPINNSKNSFEESGIDDSNVKEGTNTNSPLSSTDTYLCSMLHDAQVPSSIQQKKLQSYTENSQSILQSLPENIICEEKIRSLGIPSKQKYRKNRRAISETKSPSEHVRMTRQLLELNKQSVLSESTLYENEMFHLHIIDENLSRIESADQQCKQGRKQKLMSRLKRSNTTEEFLNVDISGKNVIQKTETKTLLRCKSIDETTFRQKSNAAEQDYFEDHKMKPLSKRKQLQRSISSGFTRFKHLSSVTVRPHRKLEDECNPFEVNVHGHETSRRKQYFIDAEDVQVFNRNHELQNQNQVRRRSLSDNTEFPARDFDSDEKLDDLHLPRRKAICPDLPVPAMKQLKTYLILTRLKQYCFV